MLLPGYRAVLAANPAMKIVAKLPGLAEIPPCEIGEITAPDGLTMYIVVAGTLFDRAGNAYLDEHANPWDDNDVRFARLAMAAVELPTVDPFVAPILYAIPVQLLAYHAAVAKGTDVDQPRNLAKSVTVE